MRKLIINADGFGFTYGNNLAIFEVAKKKNISSISVNTNFPAKTEIQNFHKQFPTISIGVHLNPIVGKPVLNPSEIPSLVKPNGEFWNDQFPIRLRKKMINMEELFKELLAQVRILLQCGIPITHLDSHQNQHLRPGFFSVFLKVAKSAGITRMRNHRHFICAEFMNARKQAAKYYVTHLKTAMLHLYTRVLMNRAKLAGMRMADRLISIGHISGATKGSFEVWENMFANMPSGVSEVYCHPGYPDETLHEYAKYVEERRKECEVLLSPRFKKLLTINKIDLIGFDKI